jgi:hypothetical protein
MPRAAAPKTKAPAVKPPTASLKDAKPVEKPAPKARKPFALIASMTHPKLFGPIFSDPSWDNWKIVVKALDGVKLSDAETEFFKTISGGREPPLQQVSEIWLTMGRRAGKDSIASAMVAHAAATFNSRHLLRGGERALVMCLAPTRTQAQIVLRYTKSYFADIPSLAAMVEGEMTKEGFSLSNSVDIVVSSNSFKGVRGHPILPAIFHETAFWSEEDSARPPEELLAAVEPGLSSPESAGSRIVSITTPLVRGCDRSLGDSLLDLQPETRRTSDIYLWLAEMSVEQFDLQSRNWLRSETSHSRSEPKTMMVTTTFARKPSLISSLST